MFWNGGFRSDKNTLEWVLANCKHFGGQAHVLLTSLNAAELC